MSIFLKYYLVQLDAAYIPREWNSELPNIMLLKYQLQLQFHTTYHIKWLDLAYSNCKPK